MTRLWSWFLDTRHYWVLLLLLGGAGAGFAALRARMIPASYGERGPYRADAITENAARPSMIVADHVCLECHADVREERADSLHQAVSCFHCHGLGREHVAQALRAKSSPDSPIAPAQKWDGNFLTTIDLYTTKDRATCLACHEAVVGMPKHFKKIDVAKHLEEMGAESPRSREACFECHGGHNTKP